MGLPALSLLFVVKYFLKLPREVDVIGWRRPKRMKQDERKTKGEAFVE